MFTYQYEVWDEEAGNLVTTHETRESALNWIREIWNDRPHLVYHYALIGFDAQGQPTAIAAGKDLIELAIADRLRS